MKIEGRAETRGLTKKITRWVNTSIVINKYFNVKNEYLREDVWQLASHRSLSHLCPALLGSTEITKC
jgi:hypothetical protein